MQPNDAVEEGTSNRRHNVGVAKCDKMRVLGEAIYDGEDDGLATNLGQPLDEIHGDVRPHMGRHLKGLQETRRLKGLLEICPRGNHRDDDITLVFMTYIMSSVNIHYRQTCID